MKKIRSAVLAAILMLSALSAPAYAAYDPDVDYMGVMIQSAIEGDTERGREVQEARDEKIDALGLGVVKVNFDNLFIISKVIEAEAGSDWLSDEHQLLVGSVPLNRAASPEYPDTIEACIYEPGQYYSRSNRYFANLNPSERAVKNALWLLENGSIAPPDVVFQAEFVQGEIYKSIYDRRLGTTYFATATTEECMKRMNGHY